MSQMRAEMLAKEEELMREARATAELQQGLMEIDKKAVLARETVASVQRSIDLAEAREREALQKILLSLDIAAMQQRDALKAKALEMDVDTLRAGRQMR